MKPEATLSPTPANSNSADQEIEDDDRLRHISAKSETGQKEGQNAGIRVDTLTR